MTQAVRPEPDAPALLRLLSRADVRQAEGQGIEGILCELFGVKTTGDWPIAPLTRLGEDDIDLSNVAEGWWLRADPVHLRADLKQVLLVDTSHEDIEPEQAQTWVAELNALFSSENWRFEAPHPKRWYLHLSDDPGLRTSPLSAVMGRDIAALLPQGEASRHWQTRLTEIQMLLHNSPLNATRETQGQPPINSVWFWGGGRLPPRVSSAITWVYAADPLSRGLARWADVALAPVPVTAHTWGATVTERTEHLIVLDKPLSDPDNNDPSAWIEQVNTLEQDWFAPCVGLINNGELGGLTVYPGNDQIYTVSRRHLRRFWRRSRALATH